ncbi:lytic murein transglycosylase [Thiocapsa imhoffii]|uniref:Lytic murein transglycosylase n=1 Tax=Thiocapsa imhoffii TaxID=382777 RepID=A0A9X0WJF3_9GAMM|nr:transglycosylase SLT domain-containing protein [Thiocapsa imhoffii]MBK1645656.1 lytic murein transglycosylase [Thiocapsa imhoffii]
MHDSIANRQRFFGWTSGLVRQGAWWPCRRPLLALLLCSQFDTFAASPDALFIQAEQALRAGDQDRFSLLAVDLADHPLYSYLRFAELTQDLASTSDAAIEEFLERFPQTQLASRLRRAYLARLASTERWADYARFDRPDDSAERRCLRLRALIETGRAAAAFEQIPPLWRSARSQPASCDPVFDAWREAGGLTSELIRERLRLAMEAGEQGLARHLVTLLPDSERDSARRWFTAATDPDRFLEASVPSEQDADVPALIAHALVALADQSPTEARARLRRFQARLRLDESAWNRAHAAVGAALVRDGDPEGFVLWDEVRATPETQVEQERRLREAVRHAAWSWVLLWGERLPEGAASREQWDYWQGRAALALGDAETAQDRFERAAAGRTLWAFLAADRLGRDYQLGHANLPAEPAWIRQFMQSPTLARMRALNRLGREIDMRREWRELLQHAEVPKRLAAAYVADVMGWHDQAIQAQVHSGHWSDLALRFPLPYRDWVEEQSWEHALEPDWVFAVMRQESRFARTLASHAGAVGLMQLLPTTAREVALARGQTAPSRWELLEPARNIELGTAYLAWLRDRFGHVALASAAYNAGPARVAGWLPAACEDADRWILAIPFRETRAYVERILTYRVFYRARLGLPPIRVSDWLPPVPGANESCD